MAENPFIDSNCSFNLKNEVRMSAKKSYLIVQVVKKKNQKR